MEYMIYLNVFLTKIDISDTIVACFIKKYPVGYKERKKTMKRRISTCILLVLMIVIGGTNFPDVTMYSKEFWQWSTVILLGTIICANIFLGEEPQALFDYICKENFKKAPIFGMLAIPFIISTGMLIYTSLRDSLP